MTNSCLNEVAPIRNTTLQEGLSAIGQVLGKIPCLQNKFDGWQENISITVKSMIYSSYS